MHSVVSRLCFVFSLTLLHSPAVGKVGKPRWGHPLVEFVTVGKIVRKKEGLNKVVDRLEYLCMLVHSHTHQRVGHAWCARYNPCLGYPGAPAHIL